ncbi:hypothetical protein [Sinomonas mesophila]|uniref:hypothetical protein n=1 Tax=Sinomonas mesophila TaxID=1531955 RepID=UPI00098529F6|nr:hypothetical protein [Sinomonas mesophila]
MKFPRVTFLSSAAEYRTARTPRQLSQDYAAGRLVRLRRGVYLEAEEWLSGTGADRYAITTASLAVSGKAPVLCRETALMAWGIELARIPTHVRYRTARRPEVGAIPPRRIYGNEAAARETWLKSPRKASGALPTGFPDAKHHWEPGSSTELLLPHLGLTLPLEPFDAVFADTLHRLPFTEAVVIADALVAGRAGPKVRRTREQLQSLCDAMTNASARARTAFVLSFADGASESVGESFSRALMWKLGFEMPELQFWVTRDGRRIARVDYVWPRIRLTGEFDGLVKYLRSQELSGKAAAEVVVEEKRREDEVRACGYGMVRWVWADLLEPERFAAILHRAGVPHRQ